MQINQYELFIYKNCSYMYKINARIEHLNLNDRTNQNKCLIQIKQRNIVRENHISIIGNSSVISLII